MDCLTIMGGDGVYWLALTAGKYEQLRLFDPNKGSHEIEAWTSDHGFVDEEKYVTYDRDRIEGFQVFWRNGRTIAGTPWEPSQIMQIKLITNAP